MSKPIPDGTRTDGIPGWCGLCHRNLGGSMEFKPAYWLHNVPYHPSCFPIIVAAEEAAKKVQGGTKQ